MRWRVFAVLGAAMLLAPAAGSAEQPAPQPRALSVENKPWKGDFDQMLEQRVIRVLMPYSRTLFYVDKGQERGLQAELARDFERYVNRKYAKELGKRPLTVVLIPTTRDKLLPRLIAGFGDIAAANLTVTEERLKVVDMFGVKEAKPSQELVVTGAGSPVIAAVEDLSGRAVHVRRTSGYYDSVVALNERLKKAGKQPARIVTLPDELEDEDVLEMLNAGLIEFTIVDDWKARMWAQVLPRVKVRDDLVMRAEGYPGWAFRKNSPKLAAAVADAYEVMVRKQGGIAARQAAYHRRVKQITNNTGTAEWKRFEQTVKLFEKYGARYGFDPLMLAAQGFQESALRQEARSDVGAIGVMQIMPATGKELGVGNIEQLEPNIHAGAKYMDQLMTRYFPDARFSDADRPLFAFASYNCGPGNVARMRKEAGKRDLDPDKWFNNVELVVAEKIGAETTTYVRNIYKYYVAYRFVGELQQAARKAREAIERK